MREIVVYDANLAPQYKTPWSLCMDIKTAENIKINPWETKIVKTWIKTNFPSKVYLRSSISLKGLIMPNSVGIIDSDYRWEIWIIIQNTSNTPINFEKYDRIGQMESLYVSNKQNIKSKRFSKHKDDLCVLKKEAWNTYWENENLERTWWFWSTGI